MRIGALAFLAVFVTAPLVAEPATPHAMLVAELAPEEELAADFAHRVDGDLPAALRANPDVASLERKCPGAIDSLVGAVRPMALEKAGYWRRQYRAELERLLAREMTAEEARQAAEFYASDLGRRMMRARREQRRHDNVLRSAATDEDGIAARSALVRDQLAAVEDGAAMLSEADRRSLDEAFDSRWGRTMRRLRNEITALQWQFLSAQPAQALDAALEERMAGALGASGVRCDLDVP